jgi:hypothetical protein
VAAACLTTSLSIYISISISVYVSVYLSISISVYISVYQSIYVSPSFSSLHILPEHSANLCCHRWCTSLWLLFRGQHHQRDAGSAAAGCSASECCTTLQAQFSTPNK